MPHLFVFGEKKGELKMFSLIMFKRKPYGTSPETKNPISFPSNVSFSVLQGFCLLLGDEGGLWCKENANYGAGH